MFQDIRKCCHYVLLSLSLALGMTGVLQTATAQNLVLHVDGISGSVAPGPNGSSWGSNAFRFLQDAIEAARVYHTQPGQSTHVVQVRVRGASAQSGGLKYRPDQGFVVAGNPITLNDRRETFFLFDNTSILGGFDGTEPPTPAGLAMRNPKVNITILSGNISNTASALDNSFSVVTANANLARINGQDVIPHVDGVIIEDGYSSDVGGAGAGLNTGFGAKPYLRDVIVRNNSAGTSAGLLGVSSTELLLRNCTVSGNHATDGSGGGINSSFKLTLLNCNVVANTASISGGGIYAGLPTTGAVTAVSSTIIGNASGADDGGGVYQLQGTCEFTNCVVAQNHADGFSAYGGGLNVSGVTLKMDGCTVADNSTRNCGGGMYWDGSTSHVRNSIFWGNTVASGGFLPQICEGGSGLSVTYADVQATTTWPGTGNINSNPMFSDPDGADNVAGTIDDNFRLSCASTACINAGDPNATAAPPTGFPVDSFDVDEYNGTAGKTPDCGLGERIRGVYGNYRIDMGAFETHGQSGCPADNTGDSCVNIDDLLTVINGWGRPSAGDIGPSPFTCGGEGHTDIDDLLMVINNWGSTSGTCNCPAPPGESPVTVGDCWDTCQTEHPDDIDMWMECYRGCLEALCKQGLISCP